MIRRFSNIILTIAIVAATASAATDVQLKQSLDSAYILMGKKTDITVELISQGSPDGAIVIQDNKMPAEVEISEPGQTDTTSLGNDRWELLRRITIQSFDSGLYTLPPVVYVRGNDTLARSSAIALKVIPVPVDTLTDIHDYAATADAGLRWTDRLPDWVVDYGLWILLTLLLAFAAVFAWHRWLRKPKSAGDTTVKVKKAPPYETAVKELNELRDERLCEQGQEKEFYTRLTEILRVYLQDRFGINAMEMTSTEILHALGSNEETRLPRRHMTEILNMADFVKFAKVRPLPDDNVKTFRSAMQFVEDTRPIPSPDKPNNETEKK